MGLTIIDREGWGAAASTTPPVPHTPQRVVVHHTYSPDARMWRGEISMRGIQRYHQSVNGWADIGYHAVLAPGGVVYLCRGWHELGAHCGGKPPRGVTRHFGNSGSIGICVVGDYDRDAPDPQVVMDLAALISRVQADLGLDGAQVYGHFEAWSKPPKTCPGWHLVEAMGWADRWRRLFGGVPS